MAQINLENKAINALIESGDPAMIAQGITHFIKKHGVDKTKRTKKIKTRVNELLKSNDLKTKSKGLKLHATLFQEPEKEKPFIELPEYKILMDNAGLLTSYIN